MQTWLTNGHPALFLAPMEGVTDAPMRTLMSERGGFSHCVTEFLRVSQTVLSKKTLEKSVAELKQGCRTKSGTPVIVQLLGGNAERLAYSAKAAVELGAIGIDLNFGCPAPTVNSHDGGATLLKYPCRIEEIVKAVRMAVPAKISVSVKMRLGWDSSTPLIENAQRAESAGASWITIHGRTKMQGYQPPVYWGPIGEVKRNARIPIVANGDIWTIEDFRRCQEETGCEHFMIGRGALANPNLSLHIARELGFSANSANTFPSSEDWRELLFRFIEISQTLSDNPLYALRRVKQWLRFASSFGTFKQFDLVKKVEDEKTLLEIIPHLHF